MTNQMWQAPKRAYKDLCLIIDSSGSIPLEAFRGAIRAIPIIYYIAEAKRGQVAVINFSDETRSSGWMASPFDVSPDVLIYRGFGSSFDAGVLNKLARARKPFAMLMVTDEAIVNYSNVVPVLKRMVSKGNALGVLNLGDGSNGLMQGLADIRSVPMTEDGVMRGVIEYTCTMLLK